MFLRKFFVTLMVGLALALGTTGAYAGDGNFMVRVLGSGVLPDTDADISTATGVALPTYDADISDEFIPAATLTYFFSPNLAVELFCCFANHQAKGKGALSAVGDIADFWIFPPSLTLQYHFTGMGGFKPYVGAGLTYIHFFDEDSGNLTNATSVDIDDAVGFALQAGADISLGNNWYLNMDVKKVFIDTEASWRGGGVDLDADVDIDPWIVSAGIGYRFDLGDLFGRRSAPLK